MKDVSEEIYCSELNGGVPKGGMALFVKVIRMVGNHTY